MPRLLLAVIAVLCLGAPTLRAQGTAPVPVSDLAYRDLDRLASLGLIDQMIAGQRPYSYREFGRLVREARANAGRARSPRERALVDGLLARLGRRFDDPVPRPLAALADQATLALVSTDAVRRQPLGNFGEQVEATIDPLALRRLGTPAATGQSAALEVAQRFEPLPVLAFNARERLELRRPDDDLLSRQTGELLLGGARLRLANVAVMVGREQLAWAQSEGDGLFLASDAPALDQVSLAGDHPFALPGFLRVLGPTQATLVLADLGASIARSHSRLLAYKVSVQPTPALELGATVINHFGGAGGRPSSFGARIVDFLPFVDIFTRHNYEDTTQTLEVQSDKLLGVDGRVRLDRLGGLSISGELLIDDFDVHRLRTLVTYDGSQSLRVVVPRLASPALLLALSARHTGVRTYTHGQLTNGIATRGRLLGDELGPDAKAFGAELAWRPSAEVRVAVETRSAIYGNAQYAATYTDSAHTRFGIRAVSRSPDELRDRLVATLVVQPSARGALQLRAGVERTRSSPVRGLNGKSYVMEVAMVVRP